MRLPNGYGSVFKVKGRRNPWRAVTAAPERKHVGYYATKMEAIKVLANLKEQPNTITVEDVYNKWSAEKYPTLSFTYHYEKAWKRLAPIKDRRMCDLKLDDLEKLFNATDCAPKPRRDMKIVLNQLFEYAMRHDIVVKNYAVYLEAKQPKPTKQKVPFSKEEIQVLFDTNTDLSHMILVSIYSGWRPSELLNYTIDGDLMKGGSKTEAGKNRIVPIHPKIADFVQEYRMDYREYRRRFGILMEMLGMNHTPHECRHTFITMAKEKNINNDVLKLLVGHSTNDVTEKVYTHRSIDSLRKAVAQIDWE